MSYARVIVDVSAEAVDRFFTYRIPDDMTVGEGFQVRVPFGNRVIDGFVLEITDKSDVPEEKVKDIKAVSGSMPVILPELIELSRWIREKYYCNLVDALRLMIPSEMRGNRVREKIVRVARLRVDEAAARDFMASSKAKRQVECVEALLGGEFETRSMPRFASVYAPLEKKGIIVLETRSSMRTPSLLGREETAVDPTLLPAQQRAVDEISAAAVNGGGRFLLHGVTGSGKTEVYIRAIRNALDAGRTAIVLVPEIALTPQMVTWFHARFGKSAAVIHSRLGKGERYDEWRRIRSGEARVVIGARSAVFAPLENIGVIVVDEEHENSYKSDKRPCYDAIEVAWRRALTHRAALVLGSATPSISTYMRTRPTVRPENKLKLITLPERVNGRPLPEVSIVDMRAEIEMGNSSIFSYELKSGVEECLRNGHQAILFLNRRGYSPFVSCRKCGKAVKCPNCDVTMTFHMDENLLKCHYCGETEAPPKLCPSCGSAHIRYFGTGTEKLESEVKRLFDVPVTRVDQDTTSTKDAHERLINEFASGRTRIMVGTQMIAKGLDFPNVTLVGAIMADMSLNMPDYRATERTFQLLTQVAGRAGRADDPGRVVIQTYEPDHYAIQLAARQDYSAFYTREAAFRRACLYPPFTVISRILYSADDQKRAEDVAAIAQEELRSFIDERGLKDAVVLIHANTAPVKLLKGLYRQQLFVKLYSGDDSSVILGEMRRIALGAPDDVRAELEINPVNMI